VDQHATKCNQCVTGIHHTFSLMHLQLMHCFSSSSTTIQTEHSKGYFTCYNDDTWRAPVLVKRLTTSHTFLTPFSKSHSCDVLLMYYSVSAQTVPCSHTNTFADDRHFIKTAPRSFKTHLHGPFTNPACNDYPALCWGPGHWQSCFLPSYTTYTTAATECYSTREHGHTKEASAPMHSIFLLVQYLLAPLTYTKPYTGCGASVAIFFF